MGHGLRAERNNASAHDSRNGRYLEAHRRVRVAVSPTTAAGGGQNATAGPWEDADWV